jgi:hypothetical protein
MYLRAHVLANHLYIAVVGLTVTNCCRLQNHEHILQIVKGGRSGKLTPWSEALLEKPHLSTTQRSTTQSDNHLFLTPFIVQ